MKIMIKDFPGLAKIVLDNCIEDDPMDASKKNINFDFIRNQNSSESSDPAVRPSYNAYYNFPIANVFDVLGSF